LLRIAWPGGRCIRLGTDLKTHSKDSIAKAPNPTDNTESTSRINATEPNVTIGMLTYMFYLNDEVCEYIQLRYRISEYLPLKY